MYSKKRNILLLTSVTLILLAGTVYYLYNKPAVDVSAANGIKVNANALYNLFMKDTSVAKKTYTGNILKVSGTIVRLSTNQQNDTIVMLNTDVNGAYINCTMEGAATSLKEGMNTFIKGVCNGIGEGDADLGIAGDVYLVRCYITDSIL